MKSNAFFIILISIVLLGCSGDPYDKYVGYWQKKDVKHYEVLQINKDGETYLMNDNIFRETDAFGRKKNATVLKKSEGQFSVENGFGSIVLGLSEDGNTLHAASHTFVKISEDEISSILEKIAREKKDKEKNKTLCDALSSEYKEATAMLSQTDMGYKERNEKRKALNEATKEKAKTIPGCRPGFFW